MKYLIGITLVLGGMTISTLILIRTTDGPIWGFPGGSFSGEPEQIPVEDWSFAVDIDAVEVQIESNPPRTIYTGILIHQGTAYLPVTLAPIKRWHHIVSENPRILIRTEGRLIAAQAVEITDLDYLGELVLAGQAKYGAPFHAKWTTNITRYYKLKQK